MIQAYNFIASWQLFPEKGNYEKGERPLSGIFRMEAAENKHTIRIIKNWVSLEHHAFHTQFDVVADSGAHAFQTDELADTYKAWFPDAITFQIDFLKNDMPVMEVLHEIMPNGYLRVTEKSISGENKNTINTEYYHKQLSVLPYSASVSGAVIRPTEQGVIRHKALTAMEEQTNMQLDQIRRQIELLALQAQEIQKRKELSMLIYNAKLSFSPVIGQVYYLYEKQDGSHILSLISPKEWGGGAGPFKKFISGVKLLADHTWMEII